MAVIDADVVFRKSLSVSDTPASNGGLFAATNMQSATLANLFPSVSQAERLAGIVRWRKAWIGPLQNTDGAAGVNMLVMHSEPNSGGDIYHICLPGTPGVADYQTAIQSAPETSYLGVGWTKGAIGGGVTNVCSMEVKDYTYPGFYPGTFPWHYITDGTNSEFFCCNSITAVSGETFTLVLSGGSTFANTYAAGAYVSACFTVNGNGELYAKVDSFSTDSASGTYDTLLCSVNNVGCRFDTYTIEVLTGAVNFYVTGATYTGVGTGQIGTAFTALDSAGLTMFYLTAAFFDGTYSAGEHVYMTTFAAAYPIWVRERVAAGVSGQRDNTGYLATYYESA